MNFAAKLMPQRVLRSIHHRLDRFLAEEGAAAARVSNESCAQQIRETHNKIHIGCGYDKRPDYLNIDVDPACAPDILIVGNDDSMIPRDHFVEALAHDVIEHIPRTKTMSALLDWADYLVVGGKLIVETSDIAGAVAILQKSRSFTHQYSWTACLFGNQAHAGDFHFTGFTDVTLRVHLLAAGFQIESVSMRDEWLLGMRATRTENWTALCNTNLTDAEFTKEAYRRGLLREIGESDLKNWTHALGEGLSRKQLLKLVYSSPERLFRIAERHGL